MRVLSRAELQPAWDGYVNSGRARLSPERHPQLLKTLLRYFGQDFTGKAHLAQ